MDEMEKVLKQLSESNKELTRVLLDIARPVKMSDLPNPFDLHDESELGGPEDCPRDDEEIDREEFERWAREQGKKGADDDSDEN